MMVSVPIPQFFGRYVTVFQNVIYHGARPFLLDALEQAQKAPGQWLTHPANGNFIGSAPASAAAFEPRRRSTKGSDRYRDSTVSRILPSSVA